MYRSILVPHAGTKAGDKALDHAKKIAKTNDSEITILHIIENIPIPPTITFSIERKELAKEIKQARTDTETKAAYQYWNQYKTVAGQPLLLALSFDNIPYFV